MERRTYLDHAATTRPDPRVIEAMLPYYADHWANPSSVYVEAQAARRGLEGARRSVAACIGCQPEEVVFTGGGSEADNLAIRGVAEASRRRGDHVITTRIEHHAVLHACERLEREGWRVTYLDVDSEGFIDLQQLERAVDDRTVVVSIMLANNEVGTLEPVAEAARVVKRANPRCAVHTDAVQAVGLLPVNVDDLGVDLLTMAAHKFYGPKGVGALYVRPRTPIQPLILGGSQEQRLRAGTENVAGAVGLATALQLASDEMPSRAAHCRRLRDRLLDELPRAVTGAHITGSRDRDRRLPSNASFCFEGVEGESVLLQLDLAGVAASSGSACTTGSLEPSHVLTAMRVPPELARSSLRLTVGRESTDEEIDRLLAVLPGAVERLRALAPTSR